MRKLALILIGTLALLSGCSEGGIGGTGGSAVPPPPGGSSVGGQANKGPFETGAVVTINALQADGSDGQVLGSGTVGELGSFELEVTDSPYLAASVSGQYFSERELGVSRAPVELQGLGLPASVLHINVATHLLAPRIRQLMADGSEFEAAENLATGELLLALGPVLNAPMDLLTARELVLINAADTTSNMEGNAWLLALSSVIDEAGQGDTSRVLTLLAEDFAGDGLLSETAITELVSARGRINPDQIHSALAALASDLVSEELASSSGLSDEEIAALDCEAVAGELACGDASQVADTETGTGPSLAVPLSNVVADMNLFLDTDGDGEPNSSDEDDDNDGIPDEEDVAPYTADKAAGQTSQAQKGEL